MFGEAGSSGRRLAQMRRKQSLLDSVAEEATRMRNSLGLPDNIDDHLTVTYYLMLLAFQADLSRVFTFMVGTRAPAAATRTSACSRGTTRSRTTATRPRASPSTRS